MVICPTILISQRLAYFDHQLSHTISQTNLLIHLKINSLDRFEYEEIEQNKGP